MELNQIGYFQFDNLIQNRIPFLLINLGADLNGWYKGLWAQHLENHTVLCTPDESIAHVLEKKLPAHYAIIVLDADGLHSSKVVESLEKHGFTNVYYVKEGLMGLTRERNSK